MCQAKAAGGKRCAAHQPLYLGIKHMTPMLQVDDQQLKHLYGRLRVIGQSAPDPSPRQCRNLAKRLITQVKKSNLEPRKKRLAIAQFEKMLEGDESLPNGKTYYALKHLKDEALSYHRAIDTSLSKFAERRGIPEHTIRRTFTQLYGKTPNIKSNSDHHIDPRSRIALQALSKRYPLEKRPHDLHWQETTGTSSLQAAYDEQAQHLRVVLRDGEERGYAGVLPEQASAFFKNPDRELSTLRRQQTPANTATFYYCRRCDERVPKGHRCTPDVQQDLERQMQLIREDDYPAPAIVEPVWHHLYEKRQRVDTPPDPDRIRALAQEGNVATFTVQAQEDGHTISGRFAAHQMQPTAISVYQDGAITCSCGQRPCDHLGAVHEQAWDVASAIDPKSVSGVGRGQALFPGAMNAAPGATVIVDDGSEMPLNDPELLNGVAYHLKDTGTAIINCNDLEIKDAKVVGGFVVSMEDGTNLQIQSQARCRLCKRNNCHHIDGAEHEIRRTLNKSLWSSAERLERIEQQRHILQHQFLDEPAKRRTARYTDDIDTYLKDYQDALTEISDGNHDLPFLIEDGVTQGRISSVPGEGRGFGVEIEFEFEKFDDRYDQGFDYLAMIKDLKEAGLVDEGSDIYWNTPDQEGHHDTGKWAVVADESLYHGLEFVSPVLYDTAESWQQVSDACRIAKKHGGVATVNTGQHVHVGSDDTTQSIRNMIGLLSRHQDALRRAGTNPERGSHRGSRYSMPYDDSAVSSLYEVVRSHGPGERHSEIAHTSLRYRMVNFANQGHVEFRDADGSLDPGHIQAQVMIGAALTATSENQGFPDVRMDQEPIPIGSNQRLQTALAMERHSPEAITVTDTHYRAFIDALFDDEHSRRVMVKQAALVQWQPS